MASLENNNNQNGINVIQNITLKSMKIISINVNSIITNQRQASLLKFINRYNPDILLLSETKINKIHKVQFKNYNIVRTDRPNATQSGGTAILVRKQLKFKHIAINLNKNNNNKLETTVVRIRMNNNDNLFLISAYASYGNNLEFGNELKHLFRYLNLEKPKNYYIMAGDLNAKHTNWQNNCNNTKGTALRTCIDDNDILYKIMLYGPELPSFLSGNSYIDLCLADTRVKILNIKRNETIETIDFGSDHNALLL